MRKMKKFSDSVVSWYQSVAIIFVAVIVMAATGDSFTFFVDWDLVSWIYAICASSTGIFSATMRFKALKLQKASAL